MKLIFPSCQLRYCSSYHYSREWTAPIALGQFVALKDGTLQLGYRNIINMVTRLLRTYDLEIQ